jgi:hypothetical protein
MAKQLILNSGGVIDSAYTGSLKINSNFTEIYDREIYPEDYLALGDGVTDDVVGLTNYFTQLSSGINKSKGSSKKSIYLTSGEVVINSTPFINFPGLIKRTDASTADVMVTMGLGTANYCEINLNVDGNTLNNNPVTGFTINTGAANIKSKHVLSARFCDTGIVVRDNVEKIQLDAYVTSCIRGVNVHNDGSPNTPDEINIRITGGNVENVFVASGTEKITGHVEFNVEGNNDNTKFSVEHQNGSWGYRGELRGRYGGFNITGINALSATFDVVMYAEGTFGANLEALLVDAGNLDLSGKMLLYSNWNAGVWIKSINSASFKLIKADGGSTGTGLRIGDFSNGKQVTGFLLEDGSVLFGTTMALNLDYSTSGTYNLSAILDGGGITIGANSSKNRIFISHSFRSTIITNNRTQNDNLIVYRGVYSNAELEQINGGTFIKGMIVEASADTSVYGQLFWNGSNWKSMDGKTYNTTTNVWS